MLSSTYRLDLLSAIHSVVVDLIDKAEKKVDRKSRREFGRPVAMQACGG